MKTLSRKINKHSRRGLPGITGDRVVSYKPDSQKRELLNKTEDIQKLSTKLELEAESKLDEFNFQSI
ncbi:MAG TPA: hypothetical protein VEC37_05210 [Bacillota bacterium]|nr:hypothetical protein [Bacillota bacterium]